MKTPYKHATEMHAFADGYEIEVKHFPTDEWHTCSAACWFLTSEYRIKPEPKPDVVRYLSVAPYVGKAVESPNDNLKLTFDGVTGKLKASEVF